MKIKSAVLNLVFLLVVTSAAIAQSRQLTGRVFDNTGSALAGVTVSNDKKSVSTITGQNGSFSIKVDSKATSLIFSSVGYTSQTISLAGKTVVDVTLQSSVAAMDEVVVIGYGTQKKSSLTGAVSKYRSERLDESPVTRLDQALQGKIAGVQIQNLTSEAGANPRVRVRGLSSINAGADPLVVVDGHPVPDGLAFVNMNDVESVEVLKDAASAAIYGSRGASGVIIITTKSGKADKTRYNIKASTGVKSAYETQTMMTVSEYVTLMFNEAALRLKDSTFPASQANRLTTAERAQYVIENTIFGGVPTDWQKEGLRNANASNIQFSVSGGKKEVKYLISGSYQKDEGLMYHSEFDRVSLRGKMDAQLSKRVRVGLNINPSYTKRERPSVGYIDFVRFPSYLPARHTEASAAFVNQAALWANVRPGDYAQARHFNGRVYNGLMPDGSTWVNTAAIDPFSTANNTPKSIMETRTINSSDYRLLSSGDITINLATGLDLKSTGSAYVTFNEGYDYAKRNSTSDGAVNRGVYNNQLYIDLLNENTLSYNKKFGGHSLSALAGFTAQKTITKNAQTIGTNFPSDNITTINAATQIDQPNTFTLRNQIGLLSYLGRVTYDYKNRYLLSASLRADGSTYFGPGNKWGSFPSLSGGWVISEEKFMGKINWLNQLKLRASYGVTGNNRIVEYAYLDLLYPANYAFGGGTGTIATGLLPSKDIIANEGITWERTFQNNFGVDLSLFKNALSITAEVYQSKTDRLLLRQTAMAITGVNQTWNNIGSLRNKGVELEITSNNVKGKNFRWTTSANFARNKNKVIGLGGEAFQFNTGERNEVYAASVGFPSIRFWGYKTDGVWLSQADADAAKAKDLGTNLANYFTAGGLKLVDIDGDGKITTADRTNIGSPFPDFTWGITNNFNYQGFDLSFLFQGVAGVDIINGDAFYNESRKYNSKYNNGNRWVSAQNPGDGKTPYFTNGVDWMLTDYIVEDGSYFALREIILGYTLPQKLIKSARLSSLRLYASAQNAYVQFGKNYRGINPEARLISGSYATPLIDGYQRGSFPMPRTILIGLDINF